MDSPTSFPPTQPQAPSIAERIQTPDPSLDAQPPPATRSAILHTTTTGQHLVAHSVTQTSSAFQTQVKTELSSEPSKSLAQRKISFAPEKPRDRGGEATVTHQQDPMIMDYDQPPSPAPSTARFVFNLASGPRSANPLPQDCFLQIIHLDQDSKSYAPNSPSTQPAQAGPSLTWSSIPYPLRSPTCLPFSHRLISNFFTPTELIYTSWLLDNLTRSDSFQMVTSSVQKHITQCTVRYRGAELPNCRVLAIARHDLEPLFSLIRDTCLRQINQQLGSPQQEIELQFHAVRYELKPGQSNPYGKKWRYEGYYPQPGQRIAHDFYLTFVDFYSGLDTQMAGMVNLLERPYQGQGWLEEKLDTHENIITIGYRNNEAILVNNKTHAHRALFKNTDSMESKTRKVLVITGRFLKEERQTNNVNLDFCPPQTSTPMDSQGLEQSTATPNLSLL